MLECVAHGLVQGMLLRPASLHAGGKDVVAAPMDTAGAEFSESTCDSPGGMAQLPSLPRFSVMFEIVIC